MSRIVLIRHGQASWGATDYDVLSPHGHAQARALGAAWRAASYVPDRWYSGDLKRHIATAEGIFEGAGIEPAAIVDPGFNEFDHVDVFADSVRSDGALPSLEDRAVAELFRTGMRRWISQEGERAYREPHALFRERTRAAYARVVEQLGDEENVAIVTSGGVIASILSDILGVGADQWVKFTTAITNTSTHRLAVRDGDSTMLTFNDASHLDPKDVTHT